jgi:glycosyltransferase involved in cell wall biosynthesis
MAAPTTPQISVVMPVYNAQRYLREAVDSVLEQTYDNFELIASNDGSTDDTRQILEGYARRDPRVKVLNRANTGIVGALNDGLDAARGTFIARMDADDISLPQRFSRQVEYLGCKGLQIDSDGDPLGPFHFVSSHDQIDGEFLKGIGGAILHPTVMIRAEVLKSIGGYRADFRHAEDFDLFLRLAEKGRLANLPEVLLKYRLHPKSVSHVERQKQRQLKATILHETYRRRGLTDPVPDPPLIESPDSTADLHALWGMMAHRAGYKKTARKHARLALRTAPLRANTLRTLAYVFLGPRAAGILRRLRRIVAKTQ